MEKVKRCPYLVLQVEATASEEQIKSAYRRQALRLHPDKNKDGAEEFQELVQAYAILSDPQKRQRYDLGGYEAFKEEDLRGVEVDLSALGMMTTAMAAMFAKLGVPIKTAVASSVLEAAYEGRFDGLMPLAFGQRVVGRVEKQSAAFFGLEVSQAHIDNGFVVTAHSSAGSRFKLLLFEQQGDGQWELAAQEDSCKMRKHTTAGLFCLPFDTYTMGQLSKLETLNDPESALFKRLDTFKRREPLHLKPGKLVVALYGDNYFRHAKFTLEALVPGLAVATAEQVRLAERELARKREELREFESEFRRVQRQYMELCERYDQEAQELEGLLGRREGAYCDLFGLGPSAAAGQQEPHVANGKASRGHHKGHQQQQQQQPVQGAASPKSPQQQEGADAGGDAGNAAEGPGKRMLGLGRLFSRKRSP